LLGSLLPFFVLFFAFLLSEGIPDHSADGVFLLGAAGPEDFGQEELCQFEDHPYSEQHAKDGDHVKGGHNFQHPTSIL
jgi:hypothetical protein